MTEGMSGAWRWWCLISYIGVLGALIIFFILDIPGEEAAEFMPPVILAFGLLLCMVLLIGWARKVDYPFSRYKTRAVALWFYGTLLTVGTGIYALRFGAPSLLAEAATYTLMFLFLTTLTFGNLPGVGGAWKDWDEMDDRSRELRNMQREMSGKLEKMGIPQNRFINDSTIPFIGELCDTCLSALLPADIECWRCGETVRWKVKYTERWVHDRKNHWKKERARGKLRWVKVWSPKFTYRNQLGIEVYGVGINPVVGIVRQDGGWELRAGVALPIRFLVVLLDEGREMHKRAAKRRIEGLAPRLEFQEIIESRMSKDDRHHLD